MGGGTGFVYMDYMLIEPGKDPSHLPFSDSEASCPSPYVNIWLMFSDFHLKIHIKDEYQLNA
jgi:hypothetical protein